MSTAVQRTYGHESTPVLCTEANKKKYNSITKPFNTGNNFGKAITNNTHVLFVTYCSADCREPEGTGDDK